MGTSKLKYIGYIYKFTSPSNKVYIGQTTRKYRKCEHASYAKRGNKKPFYKAIRKYGMDNFKYEILIEIKAHTQDKLNVLLDTLERFYIRKYKSTDENFGYNLAVGGRTNRGYHHTQEYKQKLSSIQKGKDMSKAWKKSAELHKGVPRTAEIKDKIRISQKTCKTILQLDLEDNIICVFSSINEAAKQLGCRRYTIQQAINKNYIFNKQFKFKFK